jgi:hypothetical protein
LPFPSFYPLCDRIKSAQTISFGKSFIRNIVLIPS